VNLHDRMKDIDKAIQSMSNSLDIDRESLIFDPYLNEAVKVRDISKDYAKYLLGDLDARK